MVAFGYHGRMRKFFNVLWFLVLCVCIAHSVLVLIASAFGPLTWVVTIGVPSTTRLIVEVIFAILGAWLLCWTARQIVLAEVVSDEE